MTLIEKFKKCKYCAEMIKGEALICRYCGHRVLADDLLEEKLLIETGPAMRSYSKLTFLAILLTPLIIGLFIWLYIFFDRLGKSYTLTTTRIIAKSGLISKKVDEVNIADIKSIKVRQKAMDRILNCGDVLIATPATSGNEIQMRGIKDPVKFKEALALQKSKLMYQ